MEYLSNETLDSRIATRRQRRIADGELVGSIPPPPSPAETMELYFHREGGYNFLDDMKINVSLEGVVFNEAGYYRSTVENGHPNVAYYDYGNSLAGTGPYFAQALDLPKTGFPFTIGWESAKTTDIAQPEYSSSAYCPGMLGWGLYKVRLAYDQPIDTIDALEFYVNTIDGNWGIEGEEMDFNFYVRPGLEAPVVWVKNYNSGQFERVNHGDVVNAWEIFLPERNRDNLRAGYDYVAGDTATVPFVIIDDADYPIEVPQYGIKILDAKLDVNTRLEAGTINVPHSRTLRIADWYNPSFGYETTTLLADADVWIHIGGSLYLEGHGNAYDDITVFLTGMSQQRGYWRGVELSDGAYLNSDHAAIEYAVESVLLTGGTSAHISNSLIREFSKHGIYQSSSTVVVARNTVIRDGSIGVYATGDCIGSIYGWNDNELIEPVWVYNNDGHGFELENLLDWYKGNNIDQATTFCIQHSEIYENGLYGVWHHGQGSPLIQENEINNNGQYGGWPPSHDGVHINGGTALSVHKNNIKGNAYGIHHVDMGHIYGHVNDIDLITPVIVNKQKYGYNCVRENTFNLGGGRGAVTHLGFGITSEIEADGSNKKWDGSNSFLNPLGATQVTLNNNTVYLEHNFWYPNFNYTGTGTFIINGDYAAQWHDLPCTVIIAPIAESTSFGIELANYSNEAALITSYVEQGAWSQVRTSAFNILNSGPTREEALAAGNGLLRAYASTRDTTMILGLTNLIGNLSPGGTSHLNALSSALYALRGMYMIAGNASQALNVCNMLIGNIHGTDEDFSGKLFKSFIYSGMLRDDANALAVVNDMLTTWPSNPEAVAQYYSITHSFPRGTPKKSSPVAKSEIELAQNYPNPFNPLTTVTVRLLDETPVLLRVFDAHGKLVGTLCDGTLTAGSHEFVFDAESLPTGIYRCVLATAESRIVRNMIYIK